FGGGDPVDEGHAIVFLHVGPLGGVHQHDAVLVEQLGVALHGDDQVLAVLEAEPRATISEAVPAGGGRHVERRTHALARLAIPAAARCFYVDVVVLPEPQFGLVGAAVVTAGDERCMLVGDLLERGRRVLHALHAG